jgi:exopolysaccharide biosynthesis polyprenyl glycosylphosphotransferase
VKLVRVANERSTRTSPIDWPAVAGQGVLDEASFTQLIAVERNRSERSGTPFLLMLLDAGKDSGSPVNESTLHGMASVLANYTRVTDMVGWYRQKNTVGVLFTGLDSNERDSIASAILGRVKLVLRDELAFSQLNQVNIAFHFYPDEWNHSEKKNATNRTLYPDLESPSERHQPRLVAKRAIDILGSALALLLLLPLFLAIALAIKLTSAGPVFFRQSRVGQFGKTFTFLKFRSMYVNNDASAHKKYVTELIRTAGSKEGAGQVVYKMKDDKRITWVGKFLRKSSLDELPQFINVLRGDMSLVGPRPAIPYEVSAYRAWHRRRVLEAKPGITGLWQIEGRSRVTFDDMVRMDLRYAKNWSIWLDLKILLRTPIAVFKGSGAY